MSLPAPAAAPAVAAPSPGAEPKVLVARDVSALTRTLAEHVIDTLVFRLKDEWVTMAHVGLSGGRIAADLCEALADSPRRDEVDWAKVHIWWTDERFYPTGHIGRNDTKAMAAGLGRIGIAPDHIHTIDGPDRAGEAGLERAAKGYADQLRRMAPEGRTVPVFDLLLLGVGPKGEIGAIFPAHPAAGAGDSVVSIWDAPQQAKECVTLSIPAMNSAARVWLLAAGAECAVTVGRALNEADPATLPAAGVRGVIETLWWLEDKAARAVPPEVRHTSFGAVMAPWLVESLPQAGASSTPSTPVS